MYIAKRRPSFIAVALLAAASAGIGAVGSAGVACADEFKPSPFALTLGIGYGQFADAKVRNLATPRIGYDARLSYALPHFLGFEAAFVGGTAWEKDPFSPEPLLQSYSIETNLRFNLTLWRFQPFLLAGVGWVHFHSYGRDQAPVAAARFSHDADGVAVPLGGGLAFYVGRHGVFDARFTYRVVAQARDLTDTGNRPDTWEVQLRGGVTF